MLLVAVAVIPAWSVTDKEMDQARAIAAKFYLRWANNGSGYLDDVNPKSMAELNSKLKAKEKENIKAFNAVKVPSAAEYAKWDKQKLADFWAGTAFQTPGLNAEGRGGRSNARKLIMEMKVSAPAKEAPKPETPKPETPKPEAGAVEAEEAVVADTIIGTMAEVGDAPAAGDEILKDQQQMEKDAADASMKEPEQSHTWVYILVLAILVGVVIWLVVYAANLMKRQPGSDDEEGESAELRAQAKKAIARKNEELEDMRKRLQAEESRSADLGAELEKMKLECKRAEDKVAQLREENMMLRNNAAIQQQRREAAPVAAAAAQASPARQEATAAPRKPTVAGAKPAEPAQAPILKVIYLGRANARGIFVRADRKINAGNTIYRLDTNDGLVGTFHVVDEPEVVDVALANPSEYLANGCVGEDLQDTLGVTRIITESAGTAIFENGYWKVLRKTKVRYE